MLHPVIFLPFCSCYLYELQIPHSNSQMLEHIKQYRRMITHRASESVYCTTSAVNGLSRLTTTSNGQTSLSNRIESERPIRIRIESRSFAGPYCIRPYLNSKTASTISTSIVHSKLDYCNFPHNNLPKSHITRLQQVQNITERFTILARWRR